MPGFKFLELPANGYLNLYLLTKTFLLHIPTNEKHFRSQEKLVKDLILLHKTMIGQNYSILNQQLSKDSFIRIENFFTV